MSKNSNLTNEISTIPVDKVVSKNLYNTIIQDEIFKDIVRYKIIAAILIKFTVEEYKDMSYVDIAKLIVDTKKHSNLSTDEMMQDEIDLLPSEIGTGAEKNTINDIVFLVRSRKSGNENVNQVTINFEMQSSNPTKYNIVSRAIYYAASLLRSTLSSGDKDYTNIHKVYSIWFCTHDIKVEKYEEIKDRYVHRYKIGRRYDDIGKFAIDEAADLMEVVMIELRGLRKSLNKSEEVDMINSLFFDTTNSISKIEHVTKINLTKFRKETRKMFDYDAFLKKYMKIADDKVAKAQAAEAKAKAEAKAQAQAQAQAQVAVAEAKTAIAEAKLAIAEAKSQEEVEKAKSNLIIAQKNLKIKEEKYNQLIKKQQEEVIEND